MSQTLRTVFFRYIYSAISDRSAEFVVSLWGRVLPPRSRWAEQSRTGLQFGWALIARVIYLLRTHTRLPFGPYLSWVFHQLREREKWVRKRTLKYVHRWKSLQALCWAEQCVIRAAWGNDAVAEFSSHRVSSVGYITLYVCPSHSFSHFLPPSLHPLSFSPWRSAVSTLHYLF